MYLQYMKDNFKRNILIQVVFIFFFFFLFGIGEQFSIQFIIGINFFCIVLIFIIYLSTILTNRIGIGYNHLIIWMDFLYIIALFMVFDLSIRCGGLIMIFLIRNTYVFCCKKFNISGVMKKKEEDDDSGNDNEQISSN